MIFNDSMLGVLQGTRVRRVLAICVCVLFGFAHSSYKSRSLTNSTAKSSSSSRKRTTWLKADDPLRGVPNVSPVPKQLYQIHPTLKEIHTTRPHGSCPQSITEWNAQLEMEIGHREAAQGFNATTEKLPYFTNMSPWLLSFDAMLVKPNWFDSKGEIEACCRIWKGTPAFHVKHSNPKTLYMFQPCGNHRNDYQHFFEKEVLPRLREPVILYSGGNDCSLQPDENVLRLLMSPMIKHWYIENMNEALTSAMSPKLSAIPIGACQTHILPLKKETGRAMEMLNTAVTPWDQRIDRVYTCGFSPDAHKAHRAQWYEWATKCPDSICSLPCKSPRPGHGNYVQQSDLWTEYGKYRYALSPLGRGFDTHRTWEILLMGAIPIVEKWAGSDAYATLPVIVVDKVEDISRTKLDAAAKKWAAVNGGILRNRKMLLERLSHKYWVDVVHSGKPITAF